MALPMANDPPFAILNHLAADLEIPTESNSLRIGIKCPFAGVLISLDDRFIPPRADWVILREVVNVQTRTAKRTYDSFEIFTLVDKLNTLVNLHLYALPSTCTRSPTA